MNDEVTTQLMTIVERAVRPVLATKARKRGMREELLAHVTEVYDDEMARGANHSTALVRTRERFGDPAAITRQLQQSVSRRCRFGGLLERHNDLEWKSGESAARLAFRHLRAGFAFSLLFFLLLGVAALVADSSRRKAWDFVLTLSIVQIVFVGMGTFVVMWSSLHIGEALFADPHQRNWRMAAPYLLLSLICLPAAAFIVYGLLAGDLRGAIDHAVFACRFAVAAPFLFALIGRAMLQEQQFESRWSTLTIDD